MNQTGGVKTDRLDAIRSHLYANGFSTIQDLADAVGASLATVRRDLQVLEQDGAIDRVHGGARIAEGSSVELAFQEREKRHLSAKRAIADYLGQVRTKAFKRDESEIADELFADRVVAWYSLESPD